MTMSDDVPLPERIEQNIEPENRDWMDTTEHIPVVVRYHNRSDVVIDTTRLLIQYDTQRHAAIVTDTAEPIYDPDR